MLKRSHLLVVILLIIAVASTACGLDSDATSQEFAPTTVVHPTTQPAPVPVPTTAPALPQASAGLVRPADSTPTATAEPATSPPPTQVPDPTAVPSPTQAPAPTAEPLPMPLMGLTDGGPIADQAVLRSDEELPTTEAVKILTPSVVQIVTEVAGMGFTNQPQPRSGVGTGVIMTQNGHILTNNHVIARAQRITVTLNNGDSFPAEVVGSDANTDLAAIRIQADGLTPAKLGDSSQLQVGQDVIAIGHALGLSGGPTVSRGVVSALRRSIDTDQRNTIVDLIQTDASINPGNSGGALANARAEVIGINTAIIQGGQGIGFAINIDDAKVVFKQLMDKGYVDRGFLGISPVNLTPGIADRYGFPVAEGIIVAQVIPDTAAERAGLRVEDVIVQLGDTPIRNTGDLSKFLVAHLHGETVDITYFSRNGDKVSGEVTLGERPK